VLENQHPKRDFGWRPTATPTPALWKTTAHRLEYRVDQRVVPESFVDSTEPRIHLLLGLKIAELKHFPKSALTIASAKHPDL
jgi:hypothetical protein